MTGNGPKNASVRIGNKIIGEDTPCFIIAEAGSNHNRDLELAKRLIDVAGEAGADAVKFQTYSADTLYSKKAPRLSEMTGRSAEGETPYQLIKRLEMPREWQKILAAYCKEKNIMFLSTPFDIQAVDELDALGVPAFKVASYDVSNIPLIKYIARKKKPIIMSTGVSTLDDVQDALDAIYAEGNNHVILLQCTSQYPTQLEDMNLRVIPLLKERFKTLVGLSSHSLSNEPEIAAVALGARVIEKHYTLSKKMPGPDHPFALEPQELKDLVDKVRRVEKTLGSAEKRIITAEQENSQLARRSIHARVPIRKGETITEEMLIMKRPALGIAPKFLEEVIGRKAAVDISEDSWITWEQVQEAKGTGGRG